MRTKLLAVLSILPHLILSSCAKTTVWEKIWTGKTEVVDLTYPLNAQNPHWPGENYWPFRLDTLATLEKDGVLSLAYHTPEHLGTHLDAPNHFEPGQPSVDQIPVREFFGPAVVIDVSQQATENPDYVLTPEDIKTWEKTHGKIPEGAIVFLFTGWGRFWNDYERYKNADALGNLHFPSYSPEAATFLIDERKVNALGVDNLSIDAGTSKDFRVHHIVNAAKKYGLENVANLNQLPPIGAVAIVAPIKIEGGSGGQVRIFAVLPEKKR